MNLETNVPEAPQQDLFTDQEVYPYEYASTGQRFLNFIIDALVMQYTLGYVTAYVLVKFLLAVAPGFAYQLFGYGRESMQLIIASYLIGILNYLVYYTILEKAFRGYTLGKLITGTRAIREDGEELKFRDAMLRTLSRLVPLEAFSIWFGEGLWHDRWTNTMVIKTR